MKEIKNILFDPIPGTPGDNLFFYLFLFAAVFGGLFIVPRIIHAIVFGG